MTDRDEFTKATKFAEWQASGGRCRVCTKKLRTGDIDYHHDKECTFGGTAERNNCIVLCKGCHGAITRQRAADIAKSNRVRNVYIGIKRKSSRPFPTNKDQPFKMKITREIVRR